MPLARINDRVLHFVHIPKTGGSSVSDYLRRKGKLALYSRTNIPWARTTPQHMDRSVSEVLVPDGFADASFGVVRDPYARILSEFRYRAQRANADIKAGCHLSSTDRLAVELDWEEEFSGTFEEWVICIFERHEVDPTACDNHIRPQSDFLRRDTKVFLFENGMEPVFRWIDDVTGTDPLDADLDKNESPRFTIEVSDALRGQIEAFYAADYELIRAQQAAAEPAAKASAPV